MDIRCESCSKPFRVADEKIAGKGIRFKCTRCGEVIMITKQDLEADLLAREGRNGVPVVQPPPAAAPPRPAAPPSVPPPPAEPEAREYTPPPAEPDDSAAEEEAALHAPRPGLEDFDFSAPDVAAQHAQREDAGLDDFSFGDQGGLGEEGASAGDERGGEAGEVSLSEKDAQTADEAFSFPEEMISEPTRKPAFAAPAEETQETGAAGESASADPGAEVAPDLSAMEMNVPELSPELEQAPVQTKAPAAPELPATGPVFTPPRVPSPPPRAVADDEFDLGAALAIPPSAGEGRDAGPESADENGERTEITETGPFPLPPLQEGELHPLASGNLSGALAGIGCALPIVVLLFFGISMVAKFVPVLAQLPLLHLVAATGAGVVSFGIMIGILVAMLQAKAGRKLFFLVNILFGALFGAVFGAGMMLVIALASGEGLNSAQIAGGAVNGAVTACLISIVLVVVRRIMIFTKTETFSASLTGRQKAGLALSLVIILAAGYGQGTLTGKLEHTAQTMVKQFQAEITPDGLSVVDAMAYLDETTGDLVITGEVQNSLNQPKPGWYLEVKVLDASQNTVASVAMVNGVQFLSRKDFVLLEQRGKDVNRLKTQMVLAVQAGEVPAHGRVPFELHLMQPPAGIASFLPVLRKFDPAATFTGMAVEMGE